MKTFLVEIEISITDSILVHAVDETEAKTIAGHCAHERVKYLPSDTAGPKDGLPHVEEWASSSSLTRTARWSMSEHNGASVTGSRAYARFAEGMTERSSRSRCAINRHDSDSKPKKDHRESYHHDY